MKYLRKNDCIMLVFSIVVFAVLQILITERILSSFWQLNLLIIGINIILAASLNLINGYTGCSRSAMPGSWRSAPMSASC